MSSKNDSFRPTASLDMLRRRSQLLAEIRCFFESRSFIEVETPLLSRDCVVDRYIEPVQVDAEQVTGKESANEALFLQTSPEFAMKRLLASGATAIYQICKSFRQAESGRRHNPEFTMLEWYRVGDDCPAGIELLADFTEHLFPTQPTKMTYREAFINFAAIDPFQATLEELQETCQSHQVDTGAFDGEQDPDVWLNLILSEIVEPKLGTQQPLILSHYPASQAALAKVVADEMGFQVAERFELYYRGIELANGYHELTDADELQTRNEKVNAQRVRDGNQNLPVDSRLLQAMRSGLPNCSGVAVGVDRLLMLLSDTNSIEDVIAFPFERA